MNPEIMFRESNRKVKQMRRGFSLIEIMIVIAVMAILIGIALPYFKGMQDEGRTVEAAGELRTLATAIESYYIHNNKAYPSQDETPVQTTWQALSIVAASPQIVTAALKDPFAPAQEYSYVTDADSSSTHYVIFSVGPDGTADIESIDSNGDITKTSGDTGILNDDIYFSNGTAGTGGF